MSFAHMEIKTQTKMVPQIEFDMNACVGAVDCGECLQACAPHVLRCYTEKPEGTTTTSLEWIPIATFPSLCTGCMRCVEVCPKADEGAIRVTFKEMLLPKNIYKRA